MRSISPGLLAEKQSEVARLARLYRITRRDRVVLGFTGHDEPLPFEGTVFEPGTAVTMSNVESTNALASDNLEISGILASDAITEADIASGLYLGAKVEDMTCCWADMSLGVEYNAFAFIGEVRVSGDKFTFGLLGPQEALGKVVGRYYTSECSWQLGDAKCRVDLAAWTVEGTVDATDGARTLTAGGLAGFAEDHFAYGTLEFLTGANKGAKAKVRSSVGGRLTVWLPLPREVAVGDAFRVVAGCGGRFQEDCKGKFNNGRRFGGCPNIPGRDQLMRTPDAKIS